LSNGDELEEDESNDKLPKQLDVAKVVVVGSLWASTYFLNPSDSTGIAASIKSTLPLLDQIGLVLIFTAILVSVGVWIRFQIWGELQFNYSKQFAEWAMQIPSEVSASARSFPEQVAAAITGFIIAIAIGIASFVLGVMVDLLLELGLLLVILVPVGLVVGTWTLEHWPPALIPIVGRGGFFLGIYGLLSLFSFLWTRSK